MNLFSLTTEGLSEEIGKGKELFVEAMFKEGIITEEQKSLMSEYSVVVAKKGFFGTLWNKVFKENNPYFFVVKVIKPSLKSTKTEENE